MEKHRQAARTTYAYGAFADWVETQPDLRTVQPVQNMVRRYRTLDEMMTWLKSTVAATTADRPLELRREAAGAEAARAWGAGDRVVFAGAGGSRTVEWSQLPSQTVGALLQAANRANPPQGSEMARHRTWGRVFAEEYGLKVQAEPPARR